LYVTVSNGVGGALFLDGKLYGGDKGHAGEIGHCVVVEEGRRCNCGSKGASKCMPPAPVWVKNYRELGGDAQISGQPANAQLIAQLARTGDVIARKTFELEGYYLGKGIAAACNLLNPEKVIVGGGISQAFDLFEQSLKTPCTNHLPKGQSRHRHRTLTPLLPWRVCWVPLHWWLELACLKRGKTMFNSHLAEYKQGLIKAMEEIQEQDFQKIIALLQETYQNDRQVFVGGKRGQCRNRQSLCL
jgi:predicted NBD/HSP70 family sugar kinase